VGEDTGSPTDTDDSALVACDCCGNRTFDELTCDRCDGSFCHHHVSPGRHACDGARGPDVAPDGSVSGKSVSASAPRTRLRRRLFDLRLAARRLPSLFGRVLWLVAVSVVVFLAAVGVWTVVQAV
jgi:hypothetical protein